MAFSSSFADALNLGYDAATPKQDKNNKTAYQRYVEKFYGPGVTSHTDPVALARAATGAVERGLKTGAGFLGHAVSGLLGAPRGPSGTTARPAPSDLYGGRGGGGAVGRMPSGNQSSAGAGLSSPGPVSEAHERFFNAISQAEGTTKYGYNTVYGGANGIGGRPLTSMTLREVTDYQKGMIAKTTHSPMGKFQMVRGSVLDHAKELGLDLDKTLFDQKTQNMLAMQEAKTKGVKPTIWAGFAGKPQLLATAQQAYNSIKHLPVQAAAYTSTDTPQTPAQQAAAAEAAGTATGAKAGSLGSITNRGERVAAMQRDLNSRGAKLKVDGLEGPLTRAASQQFYGSPTSVRTPSFTSPSATTSNNWSSLQSPYTSGTGGANALVSSVRTPSFTYDPTNSRQVPTVAVHSDVRSKSPIPGYYDSQAGSNQTIQGGRRVPVSTGYSPPTGPVLAGGFSRAPVPQTPSFMNPYTMGTGGANAIIQPAQTARIPQHRPDYPAQQEAVPTNGITIAGLTQLLEDHGVPVHQIGSVISDIGSRAMDAARSGGMGQSFSGAQNSGLGYAGGRGYGGGAISRGTGGAINPNR